MGVSISRQRASSSEELIRCIGEGDVGGIEKLVSMHGRRLLVMKLNRKGDRAFHLAARQSVQLVEAMGRILLVQSREAVAKGEHVDENLTRSLGRALFGPPERHLHMTPEEICLDGVAFVSSKCNNNGQTPLMAACEMGSSDTVLALLGIGADPWKGDGVVGRTCVHFAAGRGHADCIRMIVAYVQSLSLTQVSTRYRVQHVPHSYLQSGNVHDIPTASGLTPLAYASWHGQRRCIEALCELGASLYSTSWMRGLDPECRDCLDGSTPLHLAALRGSLRTIKVLLRCYVRQVEERDRLLQDPQRPPLPPLSNRPYVRAQQLQLRELPDIRLTTDSHGYTPFQIASFRGHHSAVIRTLDVNTPLGTVLAEDEAQERALGPPRLTEILSKIYRSILLARVDEIRSQGQEADDKDVSIANSLGESIRGGMNFLGLLTRTSSKNNMSPRAGPSSTMPPGFNRPSSSGVRSLAQGLMGVSQGPVGIKGNSDDEGDLGKERNEVDLSHDLNDTLGPLPTLLAPRPPLPTSHSRNPSRGAGDLGSIMEDMATALPFVIGHENGAGSSWSLHPFGGTGMRVSEVTPGTPSKEGRGGTVASITVEGLTTSPSLDIKDNPIFAEQTSQLGQASSAMGSERSSRCVTVHGGSNYYNPPSVHQAASAAVAAALAAARSIDPDEVKELQAAAERAALSHPETIAAAANRIKRMTDDQSHRGSALGDGHVCSVCLDDSGAGSCLFLQVVSCNHIICIDCASELLKHSEYKPALCPLCRGYIQSFDKLPRKSRRHRSRTPGP